MHRRSNTYFAEPSPAGGLTWARASAAEERVAISINRGHALLGMPREPGLADQPVPLTEVPFPSMGDYIDTMTDLLQAAEHDGYDLMELWQQGNCAQVNALGIAEYLADERQGQRP